MEGLAEGVKGTRPEVAEDDAESSEGEQGERPASSRLAVGGGTPIRLVSHIRRGSMRCLHVQSFPVGGAPSPALRAASRLTVTR